VAELVKPHKAGRLVNQVKKLAEDIDPLPRVKRSSDPTDDFLLALSEGGCLLPRAGQVLQNPVVLAGGKIGVDHQAGAPRDIGRGRRLGQLRAIGRGAAALSDDGRRHRPSGRALPHDGGLPLVGDPRRYDLGSGHAGAIQQQARRIELGVPDLSASCSTQPGCG
jgi:hypothetical protein